MEEEHETTTWLHIATRRVISSFLNALARSHGWKRLFLISPWISEFGELGGMTFNQLLKRMCDDDVTAYVVTRPPVEAWHQAAVNRIAATRKANIAVVPRLHTKLYCADTDQGAFALLGSANFTNKSLENREIGVLVRAAGTGKQIVRELQYEASEIYRTPGRKLICQRAMTLGA